MCRDQRFGPRACGACHGAFNRRPSAYRRPSACRKPERGRLGRRGGRAVAVAERQTTAVVSPGVGSSSGAAPTVASPSLEVARSPARSRGGGLAAPACRVVPVICAAVGRRAAAPAPARRPVLDVAAALGVRGALRDRSRCKAVWWVVLWPRRGCLDRAGGRRHAFGVAASRSCVASLPVVPSSVVVASRLSGFVGSVGVVRIAVQAVFTGRPPRAKRVAVVASRGVGRLGPSRRGGAARGLGVLRPRR